MGNESSIEERNAETIVGYRILGCLPNSPTAECGLVSYFDYLVAADGIPLEELDNTLLEILVSNVGREIDVTIYNSKVRGYRDLSITPSMDWPGQGLLGLKICWASVPSLGVPILRVEEVFQGSPADAAGLIPERDFLLGTAHQAFETMAGLYHTLKDKVDAVLPVYVYNMDADFVRIANLFPTYSWGGGGCFGARVSVGYLHQLPEHCKQTAGRCSDFVAVGDTSISVGQREEAEEHMPSSNNQGATNLDYILEESVDSEVEGGGNSSPSPPEPQTGTEDPVDEGSSEKVAVVETVPVEIKTENPGAAIAANDGAQAHNIYEISSSSSAESDAEVGGDKESPIQKGTVKSLIQKFNSPNSQDRQQRVKSPSPTLKTPNSKDKGSPSRKRQLVMESKEGDNTSAPLLEGGVLHNAYEEAIKREKSCDRRRESSLSGLRSPQNADGYVCRFAECDHFFTRFEPWCSHMKDVHNLKVTTEEASLQQMHMNMGLQKNGRFVCPFGGCFAGVRRLNSTHQSAQDLESLTSPRSDGLVPAAAAPQNEEIATAAKENKGIGEPNNAGDDPSKLEGFGNLQDLEEHLKQEHGLRVIRKVDVSAAEALCQAVKYNHKKEVNDLLAAGTDPQWANEMGDTPLHLACKYGKQELAKLLLKAGALVDQLDALGQTPLHCACFHGRLPLARMMLESGASQLILDQKGRKPGEAFDDHIDELTKKEVLHLLQNPAEEQEDETDPTMTPDERSLQTLKIRNAKEELKLFEAKRENKKLTQRLEKLLGELATVKLQLGPLSDVAKQVAKLEAELSEYQKGEQDGQDQ